MSERSGGAFGMGSKNAFTLSYATRPAYYGCEPTEQERHVQRSHRDTPSRPANHLFTAIWRLRVGHRKRGQSGPCNGPEPRR